MKKKYFSVLNNSARDSEKSDAQSVVTNAFQKCCETWGKMDGMPMTDYSDQEVGYRKGRQTAQVLI